MTKMKDVIEMMTSTKEEAKLFRAVVRQVGDWKSMYKYPEDYRDAGAGISGFIYYSDTVGFAERKIKEIIMVVNAFEQEIGEPIEKPDDYQSLFNWYAWFALEHTVQLIMDFKDSQ